jgi:hypothetical protein
MHPRQDIVFRVYLISLLQLDNFYIICLLFDLLCAIVRLIFHGISYKYEINFLLFVLLHGTVKLIFHGICYDY